MSKPSFYVDAGDRGNVRLHIKSDEVILEVILDSETALKLANELKQHAAAAGEMRGSSLPIGGRI